MSLSIASRARSDEPFKLLVDSVRDYAIFMLDPKGVVQTWNLGAERIKGYAGSEIIGKHFSCFYTAEAIAIGWPELELREATLHGRFEDEGWRVRKDGSRFWANVVITPLYDPEKRLRGFAKVTRDLTERRRVEALETSKQRTIEFLAMLAHELRNPLAPLRNVIEILRAQPDGATVQWSTNVLDRQVTQLTRLVDDLLDVSRVTSGKITIQKEPVDLNSVAQRAVESVRSVINARDQHLTLATAPEPSLVDGDGVRLLQVAINLLTNASKFTPQGGAIRCEVMRKGDEAALSVSDTGMGISAELLPHVFELFTQGERSIDRSEGGLGIGLALVERLIKLHGGRVTVQSDGRDQGATFTVCLPIYADDSKSNSATATGHATRQMAASRILVVDDNHDAADTMADLLRIWGNDVQVRYDGESAISTAESFQPHIALLDIGLPKVDGYEVARALRAKPVLRDLVLIAVTGYGQEEDIRRVQEAGFDHHFVKPLDAAALMDTLAAIRRYGKENDSA